MRRQTNIKYQYKYTIDGKNVKRSEFIEFLANHTYRTITHEKNFFLCISLPDYETATKKVNNSVYEIRKGYTSSIHFTNDLNKQVKIERVIND